MSNLITSFFKKIEKKNKIDLVTELLINDLSIEESIEIFLKVKSNFHYEMQRKQDQIKRESSLIDSIRPIKKTDPNFDKPLNQIEVNYEQITGNIR